MYDYQLDSLRVQLLDPFDLRERLRQVRLDGNVVLLGHLSEVRHHLCGAGRHESWRHDGRDERIIEFLRDKLDEVFSFSLAILRGFPQVVRGVPVHAHLHASRATGRQKDILLHLGFGPSG